MYVMIYFEKSYATLALSSGTFDSLVLSAGTFATLTLCAGTFAPTTLSAENFPRFLRINRSRLSYL